jgi:hypothetical protein
LLYYVIRKKRIKEDTIRGMPSKNDEIIKLGVIMIGITVSASSTVLVIPESAVPILNLLYILLFISLE